MSNLKITVDTSELVKWANGLAEELQENVDFVTPQETARYIEDHINGSLYEDWEEALSRIKIKVENPDG